MSSSSDRIIVEDVIVGGEPDARVEYPNLAQPGSAGSLDPQGPENPVCFTLRSVRCRAEAQAIRQALGHSGWNRRRAARLLEISYRSLLLKIQQYKITRQTQ